MATLPEALGLSVCQENHMPWRLMSRAPWNNISGGSPHPEWWLSNSGQVAQTAPEYSAEACDQLDLQPDMLKEHPGTGYHQDVVPIQILPNDKSASKEMYTEENVRNGSMKITVGNTIIEVTNGFDKS